MGLVGAFVRVRRLVSQYLANELQFKIPLAAGHADGLGMIAIYFRALKEIRLPIEILSNYDIQLPIDKQL